MHACMHEEYRSSVGISPHECVSMVAQRMYCGMHSLEVCGFGRGERGGDVSRIFNDKYKKTTAIGTIITIIIIVH